MLMLRMPEFHHLLVDRIDKLLIVQSPGILGRRIARIPNRVPLPPVGVELGDCALHLLAPSRLPGHDERVGEKPAGAGHRVDQGAGASDLVVGEEPGVRVVERRAAQQAHGGFAVEKDFFDEVLELVALERDCLLLEDRVPVLGILPEAQDARIRVVVADEVQLVVEYELVAEALEPLGRGVKVGCLGCLDGEQRAIHAVHGQERRRHPAPVRRNARRFKPSVPPKRSASSLMRSSTWRCWTVWGAGMNSPFDTICVGIGERKAAMSAGAVCSRSFFVSQIMSSPPGSAYQGSRRRWGCAGTGVGSSPPVRSTRSRRSLATEASQ